MIQPATLDLEMKRGITFGPIRIECHVPLNDYVPLAEVRRKAGASSVTIDLKPELTDAGAGIITIPAIQDEDTFKYAKGKYHWDFVLQTPGGERIGPYIIGAFEIKDIVTQTES